MGRKGVFGVRWLEGRIHLVIPQVNAEWGCSQALGCAGGTMKSQSSAALLNNSWMPRKKGAGAPLHSRQALPCLPCPTRDALAAFQTQVCLTEAFPSFGCS